MPFDRETPLGFAGGPDAKMLLCYDTCFGVVVGLRGKPNWRHTDMGAKGSHKENTNWGVPTHFSTHPHECFDPSPEIALGVIEAQLKSGKCSTPPLKKKRKMEKWSWTPNVDPGLKNPVMNPH